MSRQLKIETKPVHSNLIKQNCYLRVARPEAIDIAAKHVNQTVYHELQRTPSVRGVGIEENLRAVEYPITADYVGSHLGDTNYKIDPLAAVARQPQRENLGDLRATMDILSMDTEAAVAAFRKSLEHAQAVKKFYHDNEKEKETVKDESSK